MFAFTCYSLSFPHTPAHLQSFTVTSSQATAFAAAEMAKLRFFRRTLPLYAANRLLRRTLVKLKFCFCFSRWPTWSQLIATWLQSLKLKTFVCFTHIGRDSNSCVMSDSHLGQWSRGCVCCIQAVRLLRHPKTGKLFYLPSKAEVFNFCLGADSSTI